MTEQKHWKMIPLSELHDRVRAAVDRAREARLGEATSPSRKPPEDPGSIENFSKLPAGMITAGMLTHPSSQLSPEGADAIANELARDVKGAEPLVLRHGATITMIGFRVPRE